MTELTIAQIADLVQSFGIWLLFAWLYIMEKQAHEVTRLQYRNDLRTWAGISETTTIHTLPLPGAEKKP